MGFFDTLMAVGEVGLDLAGFAAKAAGKMAVEGAKNALGSNGLKLTESSESTLHEYTDWTLDDVRSDRDYELMFKRAMEEIVERRTYDDYVGDIARWTDCKPYSASVLHVSDDKTIVWQFSFRGIRVNVGTEVKEVHRNVKVLIRTLNARQLAWNGNPLQKEYEVTWSGQRGLECQKNSEAEAPFDSFLGVKFSHDYKEFAKNSQVVIPYDGRTVELKDVVMHVISANPFLSFSRYYALVASSALVPEWKDKVLGVVCTASSPDITDFGEYMKKVLAVLEHKYRGTWERKEESGFFELGMRYRYGMSVKGGDIYLIKTKSEELELMVVADGYRNYRNAVESAYKQSDEYKRKRAQEKETENEKKRLENVRKTEIEKQARARREKELLEAKKRAEELAAKRAELDNAIDAL